MAQTTNTYIIWHDGAVAELNSATVFKSMDEVVSALQELRHNDDSALVFWFDPSSPEETRNVTLDAANHWWDNGDISFDAVSDLPDFITKHLGEGFFEDLLAERYAEVG